MTEENYRKAIQDAEKEVTRLTFIRATVDRKLAQLKTAITALSSLLEEPPKVEDATAIGDVGISTAIRQVLREAGVGLTPAQVKAKLIEAEFDLSKYANSSAVIHNTLKRLEGQNEVVPVRVESGPAYALKTDPALEGFSEAFAKGLAGWAAAADPLSSFGEAVGRFAMGSQGKGGSTK